MAKTTTITFRISEKAAAAVSAEAKRSEMTPSEYVRAAVYMALLTDGNPEAIKILKENAIEFFKEKVVALIGMQEQAKKAAG
jgi:hypothetical protein